MLWMLLIQLVLHILTVEQSTRVCRTSSLIDYFVAKEIVIAPISSGLRDVHRWNSALKIAAVNSRVVRCPPQLFLRCWLSQEIKKHAYNILKQFSRGITIEDARTEHVGGVSSETFLKKGAKCLFSIFRKAGHAVTRLASDSNSDYYRAFACFFPTALNMYTAI